MVSALFATSNKCYIIIAAILAVVAIAVVLYYFYSKNSTSKKDSSTGLKGQRAQKSASKNYKEVDYNTRF